MTGPVPPMELSCSTTRRQGVTLVSLVLANPHDEPARVRLESQLDGPVWPPRRNGRPEPGWDASGFEGVVAAGERVGLGYATPAEPVEPAAEIVRVEPAPEYERMERSAEFERVDPGPGRQVEGRPSAQVSSGASRGMPSGRGVADEPVKARDYPDPRPPRDTVTGPRQAPIDRPEGKSCSAGAGEEP